MKARTLNLLAVALCGALAAPAASAQLVDRPVRTHAKAAASAQQPTRAAYRAGDRSRNQVHRLRDRVERQDARAEAGAQANAAAHSDVMLRDTWVRLDIDGDGRISLAEAEDDDMLADMFEVVDADGDGFVSDAEYRAHAQAAHVAEASATGAEHAAAHSAVAVRATWAGPVLDRTSRRGW